MYVIDLTHYLELKPGRAVELNRERLRWTSSRKWMSRSSSRPTFVADTAKVACSLQGIDGMPVQNGTLFFERVGAEQFARATNTAAV